MVFRKAVRNRTSSISTLLLLTLLVFPSISTYYVSLASVPVSKVMTFHQSAETPTLALTYYSRLNTTPAFVTSGIRISGDHIMLNATWSPKDYANGTEIIVNATAIPNVIKASSDTNSVEIDTRTLGNNVTCSINVTTWLLNGTSISEVFTNVFLGNFFVPFVEVLSPNGGEVWTGSHNITWIAKDKNIDEQLTFEVHLSADNGESFQLLGSELTKTWMWWDFSIFLNLSSYIIKVHVFDGIYESFDLSDGNFTAGTIGPTDLPSSTTPVPLSDETQTAIFIAAAIIMSAFLSVVVYYQAKRLP